MAHFVWENGPTHGPPHTKWAPPESLSDPGTFARTIAARLRSVSLCGRGNSERVVYYERRRNPAHRSLAALKDLSLGAHPGGAGGDAVTTKSSPNLPCQVGCLTVTSGAQVRLTGLALGTGAAAHHGRSIHPANGINPALPLCGVGGVRSVPCGRARDPRDVCALA